MTQPEKCSSANEPLEQAKDIYRRVLANEEGAREVWGDFLVETRGLDTKHARMEGYPSERVILNMMLKALGAEGRKTALFFLGKQLVATWEKTMSRTYMPEHALMREALQKAKKGDDPFEERGEMRRHIEGRIREYSGPSFCGRPRTYHVSQARQLRKVMEQFFRFIDSSPDADSLNNLARNMASLAGNTEIMVAETKFSHRGRDEPRDAFERRDKKRRDAGYRASIKRKDTVLDQQIRNLMKLLWGPKAHAIASEVEEKSIKEAIDAERKDAKRQIDEQLS